MGILVLIQANTQSFYYIHGKLRESTLWEVLLSHDVHTRACHASTIVLSLAEAQQHFSGFQPC